MKKYYTLGLTVWFAAITLSFAATPDKDAVMAKENEAWQAFKDKNADAFTKLVDKDFKGVYDAGIVNLEQELAEMKTTDMKSFKISDFTSFSDEKDVIVTTYKCALQSSNAGKDASGTFNCGTVWKMENGAWLAIFHTNVKAETGK